MTVRNSIHRRGQRGSALIEALVAFLVLSLGMIAIARVQGHLRLGADVARQRSEAVRLAQEDMETLRGFASIEEAADGTRSFDAIASASRSVNTGTAYLLDRRIAAADLPHAKSASITVSWTDRSGASQQFTLHSIIAGSDPALTAALALTPR